MCEFEEDEFNNDGIDMVRKIICPYCSNKETIDLNDYAEDDEYIDHGENGMGDEIIHNFNFDIECSKCEKKYNISGYISEYPAGAYNSEEITLTKTEDDE